MIYLCNYYFPDIANIGKLTIIQNAPTTVVCLQISSRLITIVHLTVELLLYYNVFPKPIQVSSRLITKVHLTVELQLYYNVFPKPIIHCTDFKTLNSGHGFQLNNLCLFPHLSSCY